MENEINKDWLLGAIAGETAADNTVPAAPSTTQPDDAGYFGRPEKYDYSQVELPENYCYNNEMLNEFNELAGKYNLSQKSANELMAMAVKMAKMTGDNFANEMEQQKRQKTIEYKNTLLNDRELGGAHFDKTLQTANAAYKSFADESVQALLQDTGLNCHPGIVKMFYEIGKRMNNDNFFGMGSPAVKQESREDILFPTMQ